jgi:hypothetical protein
MCEEIEIPCHVETRPYGWAVLFDEPVTFHNGDRLVMEGRLLSNGEPEYERVCIRRGRKMRCVICKGYLYEESPDFVYGLNPLSFRNARMHLWCFKNAYEELVAQPSKDARFENRQDEYDQKVA